MVRGHIESKKFVFFIRGLKSISRSGFSSMQVPDYDSDNHLIVAISHQK